MRSSINFLSFSLAAATALLSVAPLSAGTLAEEMKAKAGLIARYLETEGVSQVSIQPIDAPSLATGINLIGVELEKHLASHSVSLSGRAKISIAIKVKFSQDRNGDPTGLELSLIHI